MGLSRWSDDDWSTYTTTKTAGKTAAAIFTSKGLDNSLDPKGFSFRESCDSSHNPESTPIIIGVDVTGSMGRLAEHIVRDGLNTVLTEIYNRKPVHDPHVLLAAVGDANYDSAPLQVTQFEADIKLAEQLTKFYIEGGGGGNNGESYNLPWYFAATKTKCDSFTKRGKKGYLFTVGDEPPLMVLKKEHVQAVFGETVEADIQTRDLLTMVSKQWEVFHIVVNPGSYDIKGWQELLGERCIKLEDPDKLSEIIVSVLQVNEGADVAAVASSWSGNTELVVRNSLAGLSPALAGGGSGPTRL